MNYEKIYEEVKKVFEELTGKQNYKIYANKYFIPRFPVFKLRLAKACEVHKLDDEERIINVLKSYVSTKIKEKFPKYTRTVEYYIYGQNGKDSMLADDYDNFDNLLNTEDLEKVNIKSNKDLFG